MIKTRQELIEDPSGLRTHIVLLGAGASRAAFPTGDAAGLSLPVMNDLVDIVGLRPLIEEIAGPEAVGETNFERIYSRLASEPRYVREVKQIERQVESYFHAMSLPNQATIYDRLLVSLRPTDAIFTFNWDPFLFDAYQRNRHAVPLPEIFFLHGNVRIGVCLEHDKWGARIERCPECHEPLVGVPLLYPIEEKDYSTNAYIRRNWHAARILFRDAFTLTIFGYGAPASDKDAVALLRSAWTTRSDRAFEHVEIIDSADHSLLYDRWSSFAPTGHYHVRRSFEESRLARWPRRSCESLVYPMMYGMPCEDFPLPTEDSLSGLQAFAATIARYENRPA
jgi:hypothetical protein